MSLRLDPFIGARIGGWRVTDHLGEGAMGVVYRAEPAAAIKILNARRAALQPDLVRRFQIEAEAIRRLSNPHIARILGSGTTEDGHLYIAMELLHGDPLDKVLERTPRLIVRDVASIIYQAAYALADVHEKQIVHRDLKPANLFVEFGPGGNHIRLLDFGIARINSGSVARSRTGTVAGSPAYMSPEQLRGQVDIDGRSDMYSLGVLAYQMLAGFNPFRCEGGILATVRRHLEFHPPSLPPEVPVGLAGLIGEMLAKDRAERVQSMVELCDRLDALSLAFPTPEWPVADDDQTIVSGDETEVDGQIVRLDRQMMQRVGAVPETPRPPPPAPTGQRTTRQVRALYTVAATAIAAAIALLLLWHSNGGADRVIYVDGPERLELTVGPAEPEPEPVVREPPGAVPTPSAPFAGVVATPVPKPVRQPAASSRPSPADRPQESTLRRLLRSGHQHMKHKRYAPALDAYARWLAEVERWQPSHPQIEVIRNRVKYLRDGEWLATAAD